MSLYRRRNSRFFWCRFTVRGREIRVSTGTAKREEAEEYETHLRGRYWRQAKLGESIHTFDEAGKRWLLETEKKTKAKDEWIIDWWAWERGEDGKVVRARLADVPLQQITRDVLDAGKAKLSETLSKTTVNYYMGVVRAILRKAHAEWGWLATVPKFPMYRLRPAEPRWLTRAQFRELAALLPPYIADIARVAVATGLRKSNITGLTWDRVDLHGGDAVARGF